MNKPANISPEERERKIAALKDLIDFDGIGEVWKAMSPTDRKLYIWAAGLPRNYCYIDYEEFAQDTKDILRVAIDRTCIWASALGEIRKREKAQVTNKVLELREIAL